MGEDRGAERERHEGSCRRAHAQSVSPPQQQGSGDQHDERTGLAQSHESRIEAEVARVMQQDESRCVQRKRATGSRRANQTSAGNHQDNSADAESRA